MKCVYKRWQAKQDSEGGEGEVEDAKLDCDEGDSKEQLHRIKENLTPVFRS